ncbi:mevalonate kinase [Bombiscardovia apis]|uniref:Mevalonate kinase n=1 Tax=Bombiscardovia apis TaxID=2932182 RepID=A0ABM8BBM6_9BIFI|nr:mevalonate kinase [Bombiscardovia apis]BDR53995.1 mevalonate kinase [Bombiscardovia apis]
MVAIAGEDLHGVHEGYGQTWAKAILMGEHSVVYGHPALALPLHDLQMRAWAQPIASDQEPQLSALDYEGPLSESGELFGGLRRAVEVTLDFLGHSDQRFSIRTESDFPAGRGLGSSAAASGAVVRALLDAYDVRASHEQLLELTNQAEKITHGHPSGLDAATTSGELPVELERGAMRTVQLRGNGYLVIADTGVAGSTREAVEGVRSRLEAKPEVVEQLLESLGDQARSAIGNLETGQMEPLGASMNQAQELLNALQVGHAQLDALVSAARSAGALGAKLTGGGLGGCMLALAANESDAQRISEALLAAGAQEVWTHHMVA